ncbi:cyclic di-AMP binding protein CbpA [Ruoffia tabacinasalis]|uniref:cyclic di-AMP binding protein CbpA n=1 Tax=Ruoffia tabacinasalis TaxID=87458 RepID=UPI0030D3BA79
MIKNLVHHKDNIVTISETMNCLDAIEILEQHSLRNAPVVDATNTLYRGNIYRYHIYKYKFHHPDADLAQVKVTQFLKNTTRVVHENDTFYQLIFAIRDLPFIAVLDKENVFTGVIQHDVMINYLAQAWVADKSGYVLAIQTRGEKGELNKLARLVNRKADIQSAVTFEKTSYDTSTYLMVTLPEYLDVSTVRALVNDLTRRKYDVNVVTL